MKVERRRIFISDLPEVATQDDIEKAFKDYGNVKSVEIKERKELGPRNSSLFFAYVNIATDDRKLQQCFNDFANKKWHGQYVTLQIARESFFERLQREREESNNDKKSPNLDTSRNDSVLENSIVAAQKGNKKYKSSSEDSESSSSENDDKNQLPDKISVSTRLISESSLDFVKPPNDLIIKNNKGKVLDSKGLKIASVGKEPITKVDLSRKAPEMNSSEANLKRLQSLKNLKKSYRNQKSAIQAALSKVDAKPISKIVFGDEGELSKRNNIDNRQSSEAKVVLFNDEDDDEFEANFDVREDFQSKQGQQLLELQSKYKNDKRFLLDSRFLDSTETDKNLITDNIHEDMSLEEEKKKEYEILEQVLGKKIGSKLHNQNRPESQKKSMLRFDPSQPGHSKYELKQEPKKEKKKKDIEHNIDVTEKKYEEKDVPEVSKEVFYKVTENLKETFQEKKEFSLLNMFGKAEETEDTPYPEMPEVEAPVERVNGIVNNLMKERNPFKYDSSDDEDQTDNIQPQNDVKNMEENIDSIGERQNKRTFWIEPFFFKDDDYRLQEGFDFLEKMKTDETTEFTKMRRDVKEIVKAKVRNNQRKNKPFRKKLGGSRKKKVLRMKKAMKR